MHTFAKSTQIHASTLSRIETNVLPPPANLAIDRMVQVLGRKVPEESDLLYRLAGRIPDDVLPVLVGSRHACALVRACGGLNDDQMQSLVRLAVAMKTEGVK